MMDDILQEYMGSVYSHNILRAWMNDAERQNISNVQFDSAGMRRMSTHNSGKDLAVVTHDRK